MAPQITKLPMNSAIEAFKAIFTISPADEGGTEQRIGASYQDHVAAKYCVEMLNESCQHQQVWCESHDDIVLVWHSSPEWTAMYVQVKGGSSQGLWSKSNLCKKSKNKQGVPKPCIVERSLQHDCVPHVCKFRLVFKENTNLELSALKLPLESPGRTAASTELTAIASFIANKIAPFKSPNGSDASFWVLNTQVVIYADEQALRDENILSLQAFAEAEGVGLRVSQAQVLYERVLAKVRTASKKKWSEDPYSKVITCEEFRQFISEHLARQPQQTQEDHTRLIGKLAKAKISPVDVEAALEFRRRYLSEVYEPKLISHDARELLEGEVLAKLQVLRASRQLNPTPMEDTKFHSKCINEIDLIQVNAAVPKAVPLGCMYEVTARCRHAFHMEEV
jgi:hypothetical protein